MKRFCFSLPPSLITRIDLAVKQGGYGSRSNYIRCVVFEALGVASVA
jgi:Arc/MetJ-type ribon-helix-helix transcriptional regulator